MNDNWIMAAHALLYILLYNSKYGMSVFPGLYHICMYVYMNLENQCMYFKINIMEQMYGLDLHITAHHHLGY